MSYEKKQDHNLADTLWNQELNFLLYVSTFAFLTCYTNTRRNIEGEGYGGEIVGLNAKTASANRSRSICTMALLSSEDIINMKSETLLALVPLTQDGTQHSVLEHMFEELSKQREPAQAETQATEVEVIAFTLAAYALERKHKTVDLEWLIRRFREMHDTIEA